MVAIDLDGIKKIKAYFFDINIEKEGTIIKNQIIINYGSFSLRG